MISETRREVLRLFAEGRQLYKAGDFARAVKKFKAAYTLDPNDGPSKVFGARCRLYIENPPSDGWDGVFEMTTK